MVSFCICICTLCTVVILKIIRTGASTTCELSDFKLPTGYSARATSSSVNQGGHAVVECATGYYIAGGSKNFVKCQNPKSFEDYVLTSKCVHPCVFIETSAFFPCRSAHPRVFCCLHFSLCVVCVFLSVSLFFFLLTFGISCRLVYKLGDHMMCST